MRKSVGNYFKTSIIYAIVTAFAPALQILILPVIEGDNRLNATDFSHLAITESISVLAMTIAIYAMGNAIARFYFDVREDKIAYNKLVSSVYSSIIFRGLLLLLAGLIFGKYIGKIFPQPELQDFYSYGFAAIIIGINRAIILTATSLYRNEQKVKLFVVVNILLGILRTGFQVYMVLDYRMSFIGYVYGSAIGSGITALLILGYTFRKTGLHYHKQVMKQVNDFARPLFHFGLVQWSLLFADRYFLKLNNFQEELGIYDTAMRFMLGIQLILQGIQGATQPEVYRMLKDRNQHTNQDLNNLLSVLQVQTLLVIAIAIFPVMYFAEIFFETSLQLVAGMIPVLFMINILRTQFVVFSFPVYFEKKTGYFLKINSLVLIVNLLLNYILVPHLKAYGSIIALYVSGLIQVIATYYYQEKLMDISFDKFKLFVWPITIVLFTAVMEVIKIMFGLNYFFTSAIIVFVILTGVVMVYKNDVRNYIGR
ncbi:MAG: lipopolysaccharide biosynthesis protein [Bacteroidales bacterium]